MIKSECAQLNAIKRVPPHVEVIEINDICIKMEVDSGAVISAISMEAYKEYFSKLPIEKSNICLRAYNKQNIPTVGTMTVCIEREVTVDEQILYIVNNGEDPILGHDWLVKLNM